MTHGLRRQPRAGFRARERQRRDRSALAVPRTAGRPLLLSARRHAGCTKEACAFRDAYDDYLARDAVILGVSRDTTESHAKFKTKYDLPFTLLSDPEHRVAEAYGVWAEKTLYGKKSMGIVRSTFVIAPGGTITKAMRGIKVPGHSDKVLEALAA